MSDDNTKPIFTEDEEALISSLHALLQTHRFPVKNIPDIYARNFVAQIKNHGFILSRQIPPIFVFGEGSAEKMGADFRNPSCITLKEPIGKKNYDALNDEMKRPGWIVESKNIKSMKCPKCRNDVVYSTMPSPAEGSPTPHGPEISVVHCSHCLTYTDQSLFKPYEEPTEAQIEASARALKKYNDAKISNMLGRSVAGFPLSSYIEEAKVALVAASEVSN